MKKKYLTFLEFFYLNRVSVIIAQFLYLSLTCQVSACSVKTEKDWPAILKDGDKVLFIGNSNIGSEGGLHNHFRRTVADAIPNLTIETDWPQMYGAATLADMHTTEVEERIKSGIDNLILISSGSDQLLNKFFKLKRDEQNMVIFSTWSDNPLIDNSDWAGFRSNTQQQAERLLAFEQSSGIPVIPIGLIYYNLLASPIKNHGLRDDYLFVPGSSVQNDLGTLVNVSSMYAITTGKSPVGLPLWNPFSPELIEEIQERVWKIVNEWKSGKIKLVKRIPKDSQDNLVAVSQKNKISKWSPMLNDGDSIFYVGNSYIGTEGGLENHFQRMVSKMNPSLTIEQSSRIFWGQGLNRMYTDEVKNEINSGRNDLIVVTSGPVEILSKFHKTITAAGSKMMVHMTWGRNPTIGENGLKGFKEQTERIVMAMKKFEDENKVSVAPCGLVFYDLIVDPPNIPNLRLDWIFMVENIHQNHIGTMANAATHYAVLTGRSPVGLDMWDPYPDELVKAVQERAWEIVQNWKKGKIDIKPVPPE